MRTPIVLSRAERAMFAVLTGLLIVLTACAPAAAPVPTSAPAQPAAQPGAKAAQPQAKAAPKELRKLDVAMPWIPPSDYVSLVMADKRGWYREEGLEIQLNQGTGSGNAVKIVGAGTTPIGIGDANRILAGRVNGVPVTSVMTLWYTSPVMVVSPADKPIKSLQELVGMSVADAPDSANILIWRAAMERSGLKTEQVNFINIDPKAKNQLLQSRQVDAILDQTGNAALEAEGFPVHKLKVAEAAGFEFVADSIFVHDEFLKQNPEVVKGFLRATIKGAQYFKDQREEARAALAGVAPTLSQKHLELHMALEEGWMWTKFTPADKFGVQSLASWENLQTVLFDNKQIDKKIDLKELVNNSYLPYQ